MDRCHCCWLLGLCPLFASASERPPESLITSSSKFQIQILQVRFLPLVLLELFPTSTSSFSSSGRPAASAFSTTHVLKNIHFFSSPRFLRFSALSVLHSSTRTLIMWCSILSIVVLYYYTYVYVYPDSEIWTTQRNATRNLKKKRLGLTKKTEPICNDMIWSRSQSTVSLRCCCYARSGLVVVSMS